MTPVLRVGDVVIAADHAGAAIESETIIVYEDPRKHDLVTHRVVEQNSDGAYTTKGDMNGRVDPQPIPEASIKGEAQWIVPFVGLPRVWVAQRQWVLLILTFAVTAMALWLAHFAFGRRDPWQKAARSDVEIPS
jgi:signal peptidase I